MGERKKSNARFAREHIYAADDKWFLAARWVDRRSSGHPLHSRRGRRNAKGERARAEEVVEATVEAAVEAAAGDGKESGSQMRRD